MIRYTCLLIVFFCIQRLPVMSQIYANDTRERIDLAGSWTLRLDSLNEGRKQNWQDSLFTEEVTLPGSLAQNKKGTPVDKPTTQHLNETYTYVGAAWYCKTIDVPALWKNKPVILFLERTKVTTVWIDGRLAGASSLISAPQVFDCTRMLTPGRHTLTIMVNNTPALMPVGGSHALSEHTQTNWNGIIGRLYLEAGSALMIGRTRITPDAANRKVQVQISIRNQRHYAGPIMLQLRAAAWNTPTQHIVPAKQFTIQLNGRDTILTIEYQLGKKAQLWSEYHPALYRLAITLHNQQHLIDRYTTSFGLRTFRAAGTQFRNNGIITFLRGKVESCVFPLTGFPPTDTASWRKIFRIAKAWGINHYRFHSYTPPEAAFSAADAEGMYIQAELPLWANLYVKDTAMRRFQYNEGKAILDAYGNHPSFVLFTLGNELAGDKVVHNKLVSDLRAYDNRLLYADGSNAFYDNPQPGTTDDFWVTMRTGKEMPSRQTDVRGSFATTEDPDNGIINSSAPNTRRNYAAAIRKWNLPVIGHEVGQYQVYPRYSDIKEYTGVLRPLNLYIFRRRLVQAGMGDQADDFFKASGMLTALLYREEVEMALRTPGFAGFQLLDLQDFPGQGTALVGLLNAFMENKGLIKAHAFRRFNNDVVIQLLMDKYTWTNNENYTANVQLVNYSPENLSNKTINWQVTEALTGRQVTAGQLPVTKAASGQITAIGALSFPLHSINRATKLLINLQVKGTSLSTSYPLWVYPQTVSLDVPANITVATTLDDAVLKKLQHGGKVLLFPSPAAIGQKAVRPQFISEFWNWLVFKNGAERQHKPVSAGTLGILTNPQHPLFHDFPTEFYSNWQWWSITKNACPLILDSTSSQFRPIVQVIDNIDRNHKLGMIFECRVGKGKLLVSMANLPALLNQPEARQLYHSMLGYMASKKFDPAQEIDERVLRTLLIN